MELSVYTNNHFFFTYVSHLFNDRMKLTHIQDCHRFREAIASATFRSVFLLDANQIEDDTCFTRMMTETKVPIMILLYHLVQQGGQPVSAQVLADDLDTSEGVLYIYIKKVREKIEEDPRQPAILQHMRGKGYVLHIAGTADIAPVGR